MAGLAFAAALCLINECLCRCGGRSKGLPVVTTALGLNGIGLSLESARGVVEVHDDAAGFVSAIQSLVQDDDLWHQLSAAAAHHVRTQLNEDQQRKVSHSQAGDWRGRGGVCRARAHETGLPCGKSVLNRRVKSLPSRCCGDC